MVPFHLRSFFWDVKVSDFDPLQYPQYTIFRLLEYGDEQAVVWLRETFSEEQIKDVVLVERRLSPRSANFWALFYEIPSREVAGLRHQSSR